MGVPEKEINVLAPEQIVVVPEIVAVGIALIVITAFPDKLLVQIGEVAEETLTNE